ncbi:hypothetical protein JXB31_04865 [Candidatus Woesearchaeota archaeon]|nr:hypothetical protein [Candidatus Woesearchaeota archaeon]
MPKLTIAKHYGVCAGAGDSLKSAYRIREMYDGRVCTFGPLLNNSSVVEHLNKQGILTIDIGSYTNGNYDPGRIIQALDTIRKGDVIMITAHGLEKELVDDIKARVGDAGSVYDLTCKRGVSLAQKTARRYHEKGYGVVFLTSEKNCFHPETRGILSYARDSYRDSSDVLLPSDDTLLARADLKEVLDSAYTRFTKTSAVITSRLDICSDRFSYFLSYQKKGIGILAKTTEETSWFNRLSSIIKEYVGNAFPRLEIDTTMTICNATQQRQNALKEMLSENHLEAIVVVGDETSANSKKLMDIAIGMHPDLPIYFAKDWKGLCSDGLEKLTCCNHIGLTAGASAFPNDVAEIIRNLRAID